MRAVMFEGVGQAAVTAVPDASIAKPHEAIVQVEATAICGSDLHPYRGEWGDPTGQRPGHEFIGTVVGVGDDVEHHKLGERVIVSGCIGCGHCAACSVNLTVDCEAGFVVMGIPMMSDYAGGQAEAAVVPYADHTLLPIPAGVTTQQALLLTDNLTTGWQGAQRANVAEGDTVLVAGFGPVGMCGAMSARAQGAWRVIVSDPLPGRRAFAESLGYATVDPFVDDPVAAIRALNEGNAVDAVIEAAGRAAAVQLGVAAAHPDAVISAISVPSEPYGDDTLGALLPTQRYRTTVASPQRAWPQVLPLLDSPAFAGLDDIFSHTMDLDEAGPAYDLFSASSDACRKIQLRP